MNGHQINENSSPHDEMFVLRSLIAYCEANDWSGYDPYDALNSRILSSVPLLDSRFPRIVCTQVLKRIPTNIRRLLLIPPTQNAKAMALFLAAFLKLSSAGVMNMERLVEVMIGRLIALRSQEKTYWAWGYSFPWQTRTVLVPVGVPNLVCTSFVANALLDAYEQRRDKHCLEMAVSAAEYVVNELFWDDGKCGCGFSYPLRNLQSQTHNANFLAAALLCRVYKYTGESRFLGPALRAARYSTGRQRADGSWYYGEGESQRWIDNFHTGYILGALRSIGKFAGTAEFDEHVRRGFAFYRAHFFREDGAPRYFHNRTYPIDIHCVAQSIITLLEFKDVGTGNGELARSVYNWATQHMRDNRGFFYYRVQRFWTVRNSYMRWSQAWMVLALSALVCETRSLPGSWQTRHLPPSLAR